MGWPLYLRVGGWESVRHGLERTAPLCGVFGPCGQRTAHGRGSPWFIASPSFAEHSSGDSGGCAGDRRLMVSARPRACASRVRSGRGAVLQLAPRIGPSTAVIETLTAKVLSPTYHPDTTARRLLSSACSLTATASEKEFFSDLSTCPTAPWWIHRLPAGDHYRSYSAGTGMLAAEA
jgi:hypothetical protein